MDLVDLDVIKLINTGGSGKVYLVRDKIDRQHLALKVIPKSKNMFSCNKAKVTTEKNIHAFLTMESYDLLLPLVATWSDRENFYLASVRESVHGRRTETDSLCALYRNTFLVATSHCE